MAAGITHNIPQVQAALGRLIKDQVPFATAMALNAVAHDVSEALTKGLSDSLDKPVPFTRRGIYKTRASKGAKASVQIGVRPVQAGYLVWQVEGGTRGPKRRAVPVPVGIVRNAAGNMPRGQIAKMLARDDVFIASSGAAATAHLKPGIYQRGLSGKRRSGDGGTKGANWQGKGQARSTLKMLVAFEESVTYEAKPFDFHGIASDTARRVYLDHFERHLLQAIQSAR